MPWMQMIFQGTADSLFRTLIRISESNSTHREEIPKRLHVESPKILLWLQQKWKNNIPAVNGRRSNAIREDRQSRRKVNQGFPQRAVRENLQVPIQARIMELTKRLITKEAPPSKVTTKGAQSREKTKPQSMAGGTQRGSRKDINGSGIVGSRSPTLMMPIRGMIWKLRH